MTKVAVVQFKASTQKEKNLKKILNYIKQASKKKLPCAHFQNL